jgi:hypothetical protein
VAVDEMDVATSYKQATAEHYTRLASTLALHLNALTLGWFSLLTWSQSGNLDGYAIADGFLRPKTDYENERELSGMRQALGTMDEEARSLYHALRCDSEPIQQGLVRMDEMP